jgi:hypothetical protein
MDSDSVMTGSCIDTGERRPPLALEIEQCPEIEWTGSGVRASRRGAVANNQR